MEEAAAGGGGWDKLRLDVVLAPLNNWTGRLGLWEHCRSAKERCRWWQCMSYTGTHLIWCQRTVSAILPTAASVLSTSEKWEHMNLGHEIAHSNLETHLVWNFVQSQHEKGERSRNPIVMEKQSPAYLFQRQSTTWTCTAASNPPIFHRGFILLYPQSLLDKPYLLTKRLRAVMILASGSLKNSKNQFRSLTQALVWQKRSHTGLFRAVWVSERS